MQNTFNLEPTFGYFNNKETVLSNIKWRQEYEKLKLEIIKDLL